MRLGVTFIFFYFCSTRKIGVLGNESRVIAKIVKQHQQNDGWTKCLIVTMGLRPMLYKALGSIIWLIYSQDMPRNQWPYVVDCRGVVQLGGLVLGFPELVPLRSGLVSLFYALKVPLH